MWNNAASPGSSCVWLFVDISCPGNPIPTDINPEWSCFSAASPGCMRQLWWFVNFCDLYLFYVCRVLGVESAVEIVRASHTREARALLCPLCCGASGCVCGRALEWPGVCSLCASSTRWHTEVHCAPPAGGSGEVAEWGCVLSRCFRSTASLEGSFRPRLYGGTHFPPGCFNPRI